MTQRLVIGRPAAAGTNDIAVDDEYASTRHAAVTRRDDGTIWIEDLGSTNGTWVNGNRVWDRRQLEPGDTIRIGRTVVVLPPV